MAVARGRNGADAAYEQARTAVVKIGIPREVKNNEFRVGITPVGVHELVNHGHTVYIEKDAGVGSSITDEDFVGQGAQILDSADDVWGESDMVMKVKEPVAEEYHRLREDLLLYTYLHLAADEPLTEELVAKKVTAVAYETVQLPSGMLPLLYPMSEVAGCLAPQVGAMALMRANGGRGVLMGGVGGVANSKVVVLGPGLPARTPPTSRWVWGPMSPFSTPTSTSCGCRSGATTTACTRSPPPRCPSASRSSRLTWSSARCSSPGRRHPNS
jgi:hypothetical protein